MKHTFFILLFSITVSSIFSQVVTTDPAIPIENKAVKIIFHADRGSAGLKAYDGDVYAHTGVITDKSTSGSDWKYVKTSWGENTTETKLNKVDTDLYELDILPDIRQYYGVAEGESILQMAFVFRSGDSSLEGKEEGGADIFVDVFQDGFNIQIDQPQDNSILEAGESITFNVSTTEEADISLWINDELEAQAFGNSLNQEKTFIERGNYWIIARASNGESELSDSVFVCVREEVELAALPQGMIKGVNYQSDEKVSLVLWAPYKNHVFVLGDFNDWRPNNDFLMKKDGNYFWLEISGLEKSKPYVYQFLIDGQLLIADPYTEQISDPFNDKYISEQVYPDLVDYPSGKTTGIASVLITGQEDYPWEVNDFVAPARDKLVIYELLIRDFHEEHTYAAVIEKLDYLENLGINTLELMPVNEFEGNSSWGYNPAFYFAPDKYYGPKNELKRLVDECHKRGIAVLIDMVLNHSFGQSPFAQMYLDGGKPSSINPWYNRNHNFTNPDAHWGYDFNHESPHTQELVDSINSFWMSEYKIDGFRFDFTKGFGNNIKGASDSWGSIYDQDRIDLLKRMSDEIWKRNDDAIISFEHLSENSEEKELAEYGILMWGNMNYNYAEAAMGYHSGNKSDLSWGISSSRGWEKDHLITYMESHDEERVMFKISQWGNNDGSYDTKDPITASQRIALNSLFFLPMPGPKMIWQFGELGYDVSIDDPCRVCEKPILWNYFEDDNRKNIYNIMSNLNHLKSSYDIFSSPNMTYDLKKEIKYYQLESAGEFVFVVANFGMAEATVNLEFPKTGKWYDFFNEASFELENNNIEINIQPGAYNVYSTQKMDKKVDMDPNAIQELDKMEEADEKLIIPNPASDMISWNFDTEWVEIFDTRGCLYLSTRHISTLDNFNTLSVEHFPKGVYIMFAMDENGDYFSKKFIKL